MKSEINMEDIIEFQQRYRENEENIKIEKKIKKYGIMRASTDKGRKSKFKFKFNIEIPPTKMHNQLDSHQCNIYAFLRVVKDTIRKNTDLNVDNLDLSANYISFYDKLEKANVLYNEFINSKNLSLEEINLKTNYYIGSFGTFHFCREIVNKYGLVTSNAMNEVNSTYNDSLTIELLRYKIKCDAMSLIDIKSAEEKLEKKKELMYEVFQFLSKVYGNPPSDFEFKGEIITPLDFKNQYLKDKLEDYITVTSFQKEKLLNSYSFIPNIYLNDSDEVVRLSVEKQKEAVINQLKDDISVWFSCEESTTLDYSDNILDAWLYDYNALLNIKNSSKNKKLLLDIINYDHAMCITGALVEDNQVKQFKVENSFGKHGKYKGLLIMTNSFFENDVITTVINKKYLEENK